MQPFSRIIPCHHRAMNTKRIITIVDNALADFTFLGSKITADGDCSHEIKRCSLLGRKAMTNLDSILKSRDYFATKVCLVKAIDFSSSHVWM